MKLTGHLQDEVQTLELGRSLAIACLSPCIIYLEGELGAGKTTFVRGFLNALGYSDKVKSPTYTLVETYQFPDKVVYHFDLYRLTDTEELDLMGVRDYFSANAICLIEWPERGKEVLKLPDLRIQLIVTDNGRDVVMESESIVGETFLNSLLPLGRRWSLAG